MSSTRGRPGTSLIGRTAGFFRESEPSVETPRNDYRNSIARSSSARWAEREEIERVVLVQAPRALGALLRELLDRALNVARAEINQRELFHRRIVSTRTARRELLLVHVRQQATHVLAREIAFQRHDAFV